MILWENSGLGCPAKGADRIGLLLSGGLYLPFARAWFTFASRSCDMACSGP